ncbi:hypothetical protein C4D60_Mb02t16420 [Musa balbisiana]|uniref:Uncharacterized protein n=2 Tax=Musa balbisiana TaxID=52838 RepID=A0A4S8IB55_MUSBA|nr:hypothetical protein C4D60_Mb02t16420 [Musa balbisiana]
MQQRRRRVLLLCKKLKSEGTHANETMVSPYQRIRMRPSLSAAPNATEQRALRRVRTEMKKRKTEESKIEGRKRDRAD